MLLPAAVLSAMLFQAPSALPAARETARAQPTLQEFALDAGHSIVEFSVGFAITRVKGRFTQSRGTILFDAARPESSSVTLIIESKSIDTGWPHRDEHLRTSDFFDTDRFPTITFQSTRVQRNGTDWVATGPLTMHGVTRQIAIPFRFLGPPMRGPGSSTLILNAAGSLRLARKDFGILGGSTHNSWFDAVRSAAVADTVDISLEIEGWLGDAASQRPPGIEAALERIRAGGVGAQIERLRQLKATKTPAEFAPYLPGGDLVVRALISDNRMTEALALSRAFTDLFANTGAHLVHGFALSSAGDQAAAAKQYVLAKSMYRAPVRDPNDKFPQDDEAWYYPDQLVRTALEWGRVREATALARVLTEIYPAAARAHVSHALSLDRSGDAKGATAAFDRALAIDPNETRAIEWKRRLKR